MQISRLDVIYRRFLLSTFFTKGWGSVETLMQLYKLRKLICKRETCYKLVPKEYPIEIIETKSYPNYDITNGEFQTPLQLHAPNLLVPENVKCYFQLISPKEVSKKNHKPLCIHLAGTGDHYYWRRRTLMAMPLVQAGIASIILENPYYGLRKPKDQVRSNLLYVSDIFVMGACLILECLALLNWCDRLGFGPLGVSGISMGGHTASLVASNWPKPLVLVPCLSWSTASSVFTEGVLSRSIDWNMLQKQIFSNQLYSEMFAKSCGIVDGSKLSDSMLESDVHEIINITSSANTMKLLRNSIIFNKIRRDHKVMNMRKSDKEAIWFMREIMDDFTHLKNFSIPFDTSLIIAICARSDGYVPRMGISRLDEIWPGITVKYLDSGHIGAYVFHRQLFVDSIVEAFDKAKRLLKNIS